MDIRVVLQFGIFPNRFPDKGPYPFTTWETLIVPPVGFRSHSHVFVRPIFFHLAHMRYTWSCTEDLHGYFCAEVGPMLVTGPFGKHVGSFVF